MKRKIIAIMIIFSFLFCYIPNLKGEETEIKEWTYIIYGKQDYLMFWPPLTINGVLRGVKSSDDVNIVVIQDRTFLPANIWAINKFGIKIDRKFPGELNMGDAETIADFISYCKTNYPAERYHFDIFGHGMAWMGCGWDETSNYDILEIREIKQGIKKAGGVDIISFFIPCNMANFEAFYELKDVTDVIIASEDFGSVNLLVLPNVLSFLKENPKLSVYELGKQYIDIVENSMNQSFSFPYDILTMSAVRTDKLPDLVNSTNSLCQNLIDNIDLYFNSVRSAYLDSYKFGAKMDFYDFIEKLRNKEDIAKETKQLIKNLSESFNQSIVSNYHSKSRPDAYGLTINSLPTPSYYLAARLYSDINKFYGNTKFYKTYGVGKDFYHKSKLLFINNSLWDEFLYSFDSKFIRVDDDGSQDYNSIQDAVDNASDYDIVYIQNGTYNENIIINKPLTLIGESYESVLIDGNGLGDVVTIESNNVSICDFTIANSSENKSGIFIRGNENRVFHCDLVNNNIGIYMKNCDKCKKIVCNNFSNNKEYGIFIESCRLTEIYQNYFKDNGIDASFLNSHATLWDNRYDKNPDKQINIVKGFRSIGKLKLPTFNLDFTHHLWYFDPLRMNMYEKLFFK